MRGVPKERLAPGKAENDLELFAELRRLVASRSGDVRRADELIAALGGTSTTGETDDASDSD